MDSLVQDLLAKVPSQYFRVGIISLLVFALVLLFARLRRIRVKWSFAAAPTFLFLGFLLVLILEGFLLVSGRTALTVVLGWKNAPEPLKQVLDSGRAKLAELLMVQQEVPTSFAEEEASAEAVIRSFDSLSEGEAEKVLETLCPSEF
jgi:hypothetical protein